MSKLRNRKKDLIF